MQAFFSPEAHHGPGSCCLHMDYLDTNLIEHYFLICNLMQRIIMLIYVLVLVWLMTPITRGRCCRHLAHGKFLTSIMSFVMGAGEARPFSQPSTGWMTILSGNYNFLHLVCWYYLKLGWYSLFASFAFLCLLLPRTHKYLLVTVGALFSTGNISGC